MRGSKNSSKKPPPAATTPTPTVTTADSICYCDGEREIGTLELHCSGCAKWFHGRCLKDLKEFYGLSFMVCYVFMCKDCSPEGTESWNAKTANFTHMCITVLANLTADHLKLTGDVNRKGEHSYFNLQQDIIPYIENNWEQLTSMTRRTKNTWHLTLYKTMSKEPEVFKTDPDDDSRFALMETNLADIGPLNEAIKQVGKAGRKAGEKGNLASTLIHAQAAEKMEVDVDDGPKTRGASKRRNAEGSGPSNKKQKLAADYASAKIAGLEGSIDFPFNKDGYRYILVEKDPHVSDHWGDTDDSVKLAIPAHLYRICVQPNVVISANDRAFQLRVLEDQLTVTGQEGYCLARANHSVAKGAWYFEVTFLKQPDNSHIRIGWSQAPSPVQACVGYTKFSYGWRSRKGTKFHDAAGHKYFQKGYKEGDVLGCLIYIPHDAYDPGSSNDYLPLSRKDASLIQFKHNYFYEVSDEPANAVKALKPAPGSRIEFFLNGKSCGTAFEDIHAGFYHPAVSLFGQATVKCNFGPKFAYRAPEGARPMSQRPEEVNLEQTMSDMIYLVENGQAKST